MHLARGFFFVESGLMRGVRLLISEHLAVNIKLVIFTTMAYNGIKKREEICWIFLLRRG